MKPYVSQLSLQWTQNLATPELLRCHRYQCSDAIGSEIQIVFFFLANVNIMNIFVPIHFYKLSKSSVNVLFINEYLFSSNCRLYRHDNGRKDAHQRVQAGVPFKLKCSAKRANKRTKEKILEPHILFCLPRVLLQLVTWLKTWGGGPQTSSFPSIQSDFALHWICCSLFAARRSAPVR